MTNNKTNKKVEVTKPKKIQQLKKWSNKRLTPLIDRLASLFGAVFIVATSFLYVKNWLNENQIERDFSMAGSIMVVTIAIYLYIRKR